MTPMTTSDTPVVYDCGHTDQSPDYRHCPQCGAQMLDHESFANQSIRRHRGIHCPPFGVRVPVPGRCPGCAEPRWS
jgi:hypothetical protein